MRLLLVATMLLAQQNTALAATSAERPKHEKAMGAGVAFYSGDQAQTLTPPTSFHIMFSANMLWSRRFNLVNRFEMGLLSGGVNFANQYGTYSGYLGSYTIAPRINFSTEGVQPYFEAGGMLGLFAISLSAQGTNSTISQNQTSLKYGYVIGTGFDWMKGGERGQGGGFGVGINYFRYSRSPSTFEFPAAAQTAIGIRVDARWLIPPSTN
jgi:hypothetical protein